MINFVIIAVIILFLIWRLAPVKGIQQIGTDELQKRLQEKGIQFIDVRTPGEYKRYHIRQFKNLPLYDLPSKLNTLSKEKAVVVICQSGMRSNKASKVLKKAGFKSIANVKGGMGAWHGPTSR